MLKRPKRPKLIPEISISNDDGAVTPVEWKIILAFVSVAPKSLTRAELKKLLGLADLSKELDRLAKLRIVFDTENTGDDDVLEINEEFLHFLSRNLEDALADFLDDTVADLRDEAGEKENAEFIAKFLV